MVIWCDNINTKGNFLEGFDDQNFLCTLNYGFFLLSFLFNEHNSLEAHLLNLSFP
jgi:hypothetical protein